MDFQYGSTQEWARSDPTLTGQPPDSTSYGPQQQLQQQQQQQAEILYLEELTLRLQQSGVGSQQGGLQRVKREG